MKEALNTPLKQAILKVLYYNHTATISALSASLDKSIPLISKAVAELVQNEILIAAGYATSTGGRKALQYNIKPGNTFVLSVAIDQLYTMISCVDISSNTPVYYKRFNLSLLHNDMAPAQLIDHINEVFDAAGVPLQKYLGIGIGMPGLINSKTGHNQSYNFTHAQTCVRDYLKERFQLPVIVDNDSSAIALGESKFGLAKDKKNVMVINIGWGVGLGMIIDGKMFRGNTGYAGEFSHIPISDDGILCECGKKGCLETVATLRTVTQKAASILENGTYSNIEAKNKTTEDLAYAIMDAANKGDQLGIELLSDMAYKIGKALAILIHIINPEQILLSGRASEVGRLLLAPIQQALNKYCIPRLMESVEFNISNLKYKAYTIGAAALVMENLGN